MVAHMVFPDFLEFKRHLAPLIARAVTAGGSLLRDIQTVAIHEGEGFVTIRADGSRERQPMVRISGTFTISNNAIRSGDSAALAQAVSELHSEIAGQQVGMLLKEVAAAADSVGNVTTAGGRPISPELLLESYRKIELSFNEDGTWDPPTLVLHPTMQEATQRAFERLTTDPDLKREFDSIIEAGRKAWRDRESHRKLVD